MFATANSILSSFARDDGEDVCGEQASSLPAHAMRPVLMTARDNHLHCPLAWNGEAAAERSCGRAVSMPVVATVSMLLVRVFANSTIAAPPSAVRDAAQRPPAIDLPQRPSV